AIFDCAVIGLNQAPKIGANAMIGTAFAAMKIGISALPTVRKRLTIVAATIPRPEPIAKPPSASLNVYQPAGQSEWRCVQNTLTIVLGFGSRNCCTCSARVSPSHVPTTMTKTTNAGNHSPSLRSTLLIPARPPPRAAGAPRGFAAALAPG